MEATKAVRVRDYGATAIQPISEWLARMANSKWRDVIVNGVTSIELAQTVCLRLHIVMEEGYLDALFGCEQLFEAETQLSPIIGTGGQYLFSNPSACISETTDLNLLLGTDLASTSAVDTSVSEATPPEAAIVKELAVKVLPSSDA